jgi:hypothetical protein
MRDDMPEPQPDTVYALEKIHELLYFLIQFVDGGNDSGNSDLLHVKNEEEL